LNQGKAGWTRPEVRHDDWGPEGKARAQIGKAGVGLEHGRQGVHTKGGLPPDETIKDISLGSGQGTGHEQISRMAWELEGMSGTEGGFRASPTMKVGRTRHADRVVAMVPLGRLSAANKKFMWV